MAGAPSAWTQFLAELKRRRVFRVAVVYLAASFVVIQAAPSLFQALLLPDWAFRLLVVLLILGFIVAVPLAWAYDVGPGGIQRTLPADEGPAGGTEPLPHVRWWPVAIAGFVVFGVLVYIALAVRGSRRGAGAPTVRSVTRLTSAPGAEWFPSLSPDGQWLLYSGEESGNRDIYLRAVDGQNPINLTRDSPDDDDQPAFSPDGTRIAFRSARDDGGIFVMGRTGEAVRRVTHAGYHPTWSPDGKALAYATENVDVNPQNSQTLSELWVVDINTGRTRRLPVVDATMPAWSPHGDRIAFFMRLGNPARGHIWTVPPRGGQPTQLTSGRGRDWSPAWSPDGGYLYFASDRGGSMNLWRVRVDESSGRALADPEPVTTPATSLAHPALSGDGRRIAYTSFSVTANVQKVAFDPVRGAVVGEPQWVTHGSRRWSNPEPSPDGQAVVFTSLTEPEGDLYLIRSDGTGLRQLTGDTATDRFPRWSPDGRWIAFFSDRSGPIQIWKIRPDGSDLTQLTDGPGGAAYAVWSPDGRQLAGGANSSFFVFDPTRSSKEWAPQRMPAPPPALAPFVLHSWSPDGARMAGMTGTGPGGDLGVVLYDFLTGTFRHLTYFGEWPVWLPDSRRLLFVSAGNAFYVVDRETGQPHKVLSAGRDVIGPPQLTPDGRTAYYTRRVTEADIWLATLP